MKLFLDLDGVLADFDTAANAALNGECHYRYDFIHGGDALWERLNAVPDFFANFGPMPDWHELWNAVVHLEPVILTALPKTNPSSVDEQKRRWVYRWLGPYVEVVTCQTKEKPRYAKNGSILVDDRSVNQKAWTDAGGHFILHNRAVHTVTKLKQMGVI